MAKKHLQHIKSSQANKIPTAADLMYGEIAVNYADGSEKLFIKNSNDEIVPFVSAKVIEENELAVAAGMAQLNDDINGISTNVETLSTSVEGLLGDVEGLSSDIDGLSSNIENLSADIEDLSQTVEDNELVTAGALTQLNESIEAIRPSIDEINERLDGIDDSKPNWDNLESVTYGELVTKVNNGELVPGRYYKIINYNTTTSQEDTRSAGHDFCVIVLALSENKLSENAYATQKAGDTYFSDSNLSAWKLKYCLTNDTERFAWADDTNGKGVIYYMKDEWNNECPYDFKNIQFKRWAVTNVTSTVLSSNALSHLNEKFVYTDNGGIHFSAKNFVGHYLPNTTTITATVDNNNSGWYYTFHGINSNDGQTANDSYDMSTTPFKLTQEFIDALVEKNSGTNIKDMCYDNSILPLYEEYFINNVYTKGRLVLNNIVFINAFSYCYYSTDYDSWEYNTNKCYANHFENNCAYNTFGPKCTGNTFGVSCISNTFANDCSNNVFGNIFEENTFGAECAENTFGAKCTKNTFGWSCMYNKIDNNCLANGIGNLCQYNNIGKTFSNNQTGDSFSGNNLLNSMINNIIGNECMDNVFGDGFNNNTFGNNCRNNSFGNDVCYIKALVTNDNTLTATPLDNISFIIIENGNKRINITTTGNTTYNNPLRNIKISQGVNNAIIDGTNNSNWKTISHNTLNDTFRTVYQPANSVTVSI